MFYYKKGSIIHTRPWNRPTSEVFNQWLNEWSKLEGLSSYDVYLSGAFCQNYFLNKNLETWDIDLSLYSGPVQEKDYKVLKNLLNQAVIIGFKYDLLIDIFWRNQIPLDEKFADRSIKTYTEITKKTDCEDWIQGQSCPFKQLIPGLYYYYLDSTRAYNKYKNKNYEICSKKLLL